MSASTKTVQSSDITVTSSAVVRVCWLSPQLVLSFNQFVLGVANAVVGVLAFISTLAGFLFLHFVISIILTLMATLTAYAAAATSAHVDHFFGFLRMPCGSGAILVVAGSMAVGLSPIGEVVGVGSIAWGAVAFLAHFWLKCKGSAVNVPLSAFFGGRAAQENAGPSVSASSMEPKVQWPPPGTTTSASM